MKANVLGYSLNQRGLFAGVVRDPRDRRIKFSGGKTPCFLLRIDLRSIDLGQLVASEREEEIFKILGVPWQEPHERVRGC